MDDRPSKQPPPPPSSRPPTLNYRSPIPSDRTDPRAGVKFVGGFGIALGVVGAGVAVANRAYGYGAIPVLLLYTPAAVLLVGLALVVPHKTRMLGAGVLATFAVGALIVLSLCAR